MFEVVISLLFALNIEISVGDGDILNFKNNVDELVSARENKIESHFRLTLNNEFIKFTSTFDSIYASDADKVKVLKVLHKLIFYSKNPEQSNYAHKVFQSLEYKSETDYSMISEILMYSKQFELVKNLGYNDVFDKYRIVDNYHFKLGDSPSYWDIDLKNKILSRKKVPDYSADKALIVMSLSCPFSVSAVDEIYNSKELKNIFLHKSYWLIATNSEFNPLDVDKFISKYKDFEFLVINSPSEWPSVDSWKTPTFYFPSNDKIQGWLGEETAEKIIENFKTK